MALPRPTGRAASPLLPAALALLIAGAVAAIHTRAAFHYFRPTTSSLFEAFLPWGPHLLTEWARHAGRLLAAALFFASLPGLGRRFLRALRVEAPLPPFVPAAVGLVLWSLAGLLLAAAGFCRPTTLKVASLVLVAAGLSRESLPPPGEGWRGYFAAPQNLALIGFAALYLLTTLVPDTFYDAWFYHLAVPDAWLKAGRLTDMPDNLHARLPGLIQSLYLWGLAWSDDRLCKLINLGAGLLFAGALAAWGAAKFSREAGRWAALLLLSSPLIGVNLWSCANDVPCALFFFLALAVWLESWDGGEPDRRRLALAGFLFGAAAATKYTALFGAPYFALDLIVRRRRAGRLGLAGPALVFAAGAALPLLPWWVRTGFWTGNPFFPKAAALFAGDTPENLALLARWTDEARGAGTFAGRALSLARESLTGVREGRFGFIGPALLMLLPLAPFLKRAGAAKPLAGCAAVSYLLYASTTGRLRYFIPQLGPLVLLAGACLADFTSTVEEHWRSSAFLARRPLMRLADPGRWMTLLVAAVLFLNGLWLVSIFQTFNAGWDVVWGRVTPRDYLRREHIGVYGHPSKKALDFLAETRAEGRVLLVGEARSYGSPIAADASGAFNAPGYAKRLRADPAPADFVRRLRADGYTYVLLNAPELKRVTPEEYRDAETLKKLGAVLDALAPPVYRDEWTVLFEVPRDDGKSP